MSQATYAIPNFSGGEISDFAQGRFDKPDYRVSLNVCLNAFPVEIGTWVRRPGTQFAGTTRGGVQGRAIEFDFEQSTPVTLELVNGWMRFRQGVSWLYTNDQQSVLSISAANPAVVNVASAWPTGATVVFSNLGTSCPLLQNRQFTITNIDGTHFSLQDALTSVNIDGSTLGSLTGTPVVSRIQEMATPYVGGSWATVRLVQAETTGIALQGGTPPQALTVTTPFSSTASAQFSLIPAILNDGPYLDPFTNGVQATPSATTGLITLNLSFALYVSTTAYPKGAFVSATGVNYVSLVDQNVGNTPVSSPSFWATTSVAAAINNGQGFLGTDTGRLVRLLSEPALWAAGSSYSLGNVVSYNPSGTPGATTYWQSLTNTNVGHAPGADLTNWQIVPSGAALWTWGKITGLSNVINPALSGSANIGSMTLDGGLAAAFDGNFSKVSLSSAQALATAGPIFIPTSISLTSYVGKNYTGASAQKIQQATIYPSTDTGFSFGTENSGGFQIASFSPPIIMNLRASNSLPASSSNGTLLGTTGTISNSTSAVTIISSDQTTTWNYVWIEIETFSVVGPSEIHPVIGWALATIISQVSFYNPPGTGTGSGATVEILGTPLLYTNTVLTWRLGAYSNTTGWPTCGCYADGRLWLGGAIPNRFDASTSNGIVPGSSVVNFAPTDQYGVVAASNAISETLNSDGVNPIFWMKPDLQGILMGTQAGEFLILAPTSGSIAPNNITARHVTKIGSSFIEPVRTEHTLTFVRRYGRKLMEYFADVYSGKFSAPNLADKAQHIPRTGIAELAYTDAVTPVIWGRNTDGSWFGITYKRDSLASAQPPSYYGWHRHSLGSGRIVESITEGPSVGGDLDALSMVTNDLSTNVRHVEVLTDTQDELSPLTSAWFLDDAVVPSSTVSSSTPAGGAPYGGLTINGLWHLNGKTVSVFAGGLDCGDFAVANGSCFVPYGDGVSGGTGSGLFTATYVTSITPFPVVVGFTYNSDGQMVRPISIADTGARLGPALGDLRRNHRYSMLLNNTLGLSVGGSSFSNLLPALFQQPNGAAIPALTTFSGVHQDSLKDDYSYDGMISWRVSRPYPANVVAISGNISTKDQ